jgi:hypothetical protein
VNRARPMTPAGSARPVAHPRTMTDPAPTYPVWTRGADTTGTGRGCHRSHAPAGSVRRVTPRHARPPRDRRARERWPGARRRSGPTLALPAGTTRPAPPSPAGTTPRPHRRAPSRSRAAPAGRAIPCRPDQSCSDVRPTAQELGRALAGGGEDEDDPVLGPQDVSGVEIPDEAGGPARAVVRRGGGQAGQPVVRCGGVQSEDTPGSRRERLGDGAPFEVRLPGDLEGGAEQHAALHPDRARICRPIMAPAKAGAARVETLRLRVRARRWAARSVRWTAVAKSSYRRSATRTSGLTERAYREASRLVVSLLEGEQGVRSLAPGGFQDAFPGDVTDDGRHAQAAGERDAVGLGVLLHAHHRDAEFRQAGRHTGADPARAEQGECAQARVGHPAVAGRGAFRRAQQQPVGLDDLAGAGDGRGRAGAAVSASDRTVVEVSRASGSKPGTARGAACRGVPQVLGRAGAEARARPTGPPRRAGGTTRVDPLPDSVVSSAARRSANASSPHTIMWPGCGGPRVGWAKGP